jgi:hypothetical protein
MPKVEKEITVAAPLSTVYHRELENVEEMKLWRPTRRDGRSGRPATHRLRLRTLK